MFFIWVLLSGTNKFKFNDFIMVQRVLEHCHEAKTQQIMMDEVFQFVCMLAQDQYGNYVVQVCHLFWHLLTSLYH